MPFFFDHITFSNGSRVISGTSYWFKCEPLIWNIIFVDDNNYYLLCDELIDAHCFNSTKTRIINGTTVYGNNYEHSDIRQWLNNDFYELAFGMCIGDYIIDSYVDNSAATTKNSNNPNICSNTNDKVFLPSYQDYVANFMLGETQLMEDLTDFAVARGGTMQTSSYSTYFKKGLYWTRSPNASTYASSDPRSMFVNCDGRLTDSASLSSTLCVRPAIQIELSNE